MTYITQLIYLKPGAEEVFHRFEDLAIPLISNYKGELLLRIRPDSDGIISGKLDSPYEVHLIAFESEADFQAFMKDEERKKFLHLKEESIQSVLLIKGEAL